jgi:hypothetical protein
MSGVDFPYICTSNFITLNMLLKQLQQNKMFNKLGNQ